ncbi:MAG TPA: hypothetical protein VGF59_29205 [Bryobacteraceae bacterium]
MTRAGAAAAAAFLIAGSSSAKALESLRKPDRAALAHLRPAHWYDAHFRHVGASVNPFHTDACETT